MKANLFDINGNKSKEITLPSCFSAKIREDIVLKVLESKKIKQPYSPSPTGGKHHSASGKMRHRRHVWQTHYGKGMSRIPRKVMSRSGTQFRWVGAEIASTRGGRRAHPPKIISMLNRSKINKNEMKIALLSAISATANEKMILKKYSTLEKIEKIPFIIEEKLLSQKTKGLLKILKNILGEKIFSLGIKKKRIRGGVGKLRGRRYRSNSGMLMVVGEKEKLKTSLFDVVNVKNLGVNDLAQGGMGRITIYTENAIKHLEKLK